MLGVVPGHISKNPNYPEYLLAGHINSIGLQFVRMTYNSRAYAFSHKRSKNKGQIFGSKRSRFPGSSSRTPKIDPVYGPDLLRDIPSQEQNRLMRAWGYDQNLRYKRLYNLAKLMGLTRTSLGETSEQKLTNVKIKILTYSNLRLHTL